MTISKKCALLLEVYGPGDVLCFTQECHHEATHYWNDMPICLNHRLTDEQKAEICEVADYEYQRLIEALAADEHQPLRASQRNRKRAQ